MNGMIERWEDEGGSLPPPRPRVQRSWLARLVEFIKSLWRSLTERMHTGSAEARS